MLDKRVFYAMLLIGITLLSSSFILSYSVQRGLGDLEVVRKSVLNHDGTNVSVVVYRPYYPTIETLTPVVVSIYGTGESVDTLFAFNIELARRNMTVISVESRKLEIAMGLLDESTLNDSATTYLRALDFVRSTYEVNQETFGILAHDEGIQVALRMMQYSDTPRAVVAFGDLGRLTDESFSVVEGNLLIAVGKDDSQSLTKGTGIMEAVSGMTEIEVGITYGSLDNLTAFRLTTGRSTSMSDTLDSAIVHETSTWMVSGLQGTAQLARTLQVDAQVFWYQIYADYLRAYSFVFIGVAGVLLVYTTLRPRSKKTTSSPQTDEN